MIHRFHKNVHMYSVGDYIEVDPSHIEITNKGNLVFHDGKGHSVTPRATDRWFNIDFYTQPYIDCREFFDAL